MESSSLPIPTDSLYKFVALSTLTLFAFLIYTLDSRLFELQNKIRRLQVDSMIADADKQSDEIKLKGRGGFPPKPLPENATPQQIADDEGIIAIQDMIDAKIMEMNHLDIQQNGLRTYQLAYILSLGGFAILCLCASIWGFWRWYHKIQKIEDRILQLNLEKAERENKETNSK